MSLVHKEKVIFLNFWKNCLKTVIWKPGNQQELRSDLVRLEKKVAIAQRGARTHDPEIKSLMLYRLS